MQNSLSQVQGKLLCAENKCMDKLIIEPQTFRGYQIVQGLG